MPNRLEPVNLADFTGGLNLRKNQFQLSANESPEMNNISIDPLGGIYTRLGWQRWSTDIVPADTAWDPRRAYLSQLGDGTDVIYVAANSKVFSSNVGTTFTDLGLAAQGNPHMADFASYGDDTYIALGRNQQMARRRGTTAPTLLTAPGFNDDYLNPVGGKAPKAECVEAHSGYLFVANIVDTGVTCPNRIRWSHPTSPEDWAQADYIDLSIGGNYISALMSYEDHLLIFKPDGIWALYGYNSESWQLVQKSSTVGARSPQVVTRNESAVFFYSASDRGGIYAYTGERPVEISEQLRYALEQLIHPELVWVGWVARKLWVTLPWTYTGPTMNNVASFVFDPSLGQGGAWMYYMSRAGSLGPIVAGSNTDTQLRPMGVLRSIETPCVVRLEALDRPADEVWAMSVLGYNNPDLLPPDNEGFLTTGADEEIILGGQAGDQAFETYYRTGWITADWPTRKKSFRRPDFICRITGTDHELQVRSFRDYEELQAKRQHTVYVPAGAPVGPAGTPGQAAAIWGHFRWDDGTLWNQEGDPPVPGVGQKQGATIRRSSSFGLCRALQLRVAGLTPKAKWGVDAIIVKIVMRRFR
jgi:hypothetical protein